MIAKMKKVFLVLLESKKTRDIELLRELGLVHLEDCAGESESLYALQEKRSQYLAVLRTLEEFGEITAEAEQGINEDEIVSLVEQLNSDMKVCQENLQKTVQEINRIRAWGDFDPADIKLINDNHRKVRMFEVSKDQYRKLLERNEDRMSAKDSSLWIIPCKNPDKNIIRCVSFGPVDIPHEITPFMIPQKGLTVLEQEVQDISIEIESIKEKLKSSVSAVPSLKMKLRELDEKIEFESVISGAGREEGLSYLKGYLPEDKENELKAAAKNHGWAFCLDTPSEEDLVPTLVKRPGPVRIIKPVFDLMGTTPGYRETDISFMFLLAFTLFVAMIIGDAGYGLIFLLIGIIGLIKMPKGKRLPFQLTSLLAVGTIIWGAVTGTWFGSQTLASFTFFKSVVIPSIASFPGEGVSTVQAVQLFCFSIGLVHLSLARLEMFFRTLPRLRAFAELGWWLMLCGLYILVLNIVLGLDGLFGFSLGQYTIPLLASGFGLVVIFANQDGKFFKGVLAGVNPINLLLNFLDGVSAFSNIISYVRLFAVGLASVAVASSFNLMAAGIGFSGPAAIGASLVLFIGHSLNIVMGVMSIVVHGIRLNMLEYSGHMGLEWSGFPYEPFGRRV